MLMEVDMALPTKRTPAKGDISTLMVLIYGVTGIGKSTFCHRFGEIMFLPTDPGLGHLDAYRWNDQEIINTWEELWQAYADLKETPGQFKAVCLDNLSRAHQLVVNWILRKTGVSHETDIGGDSNNSKGYSMVNREFLRYISALRSLGVGLYLTAHEREHQIIENKVKVTKIGPDVTTSIMNQIVGTCDVVLYGFPYAAKEESTEGEGDKEIPVTKTRHLMRTKPSDRWIAKDRFGIFPPTMDLNFNLFRKTFIEGMKRKAGEIPADTVVPEPKQVDRQTVNQSAPPGIRFASSDVEQPVDSTVKQSDKQENIPIPGTTVNKKVDTTTGATSGAKPDIKPDTKATEPTKK